MLGLFQRRQRVPALGGALGVAMALVCNDRVDLALLCHTLSPCHLERVRESYHSFPGALRKICLYRFQYTKNLVHTGRKTHKIQQHATYHRISIPIVSFALPAPRCTWFLKRPGWIILMCTSNLGALRRGRPCDINVLWLSHGFPSHCLWRKPSATPKAISAQLYKNLYLLIKYISVILCVCS